jgi:hypothetical protein
MTHCAEWNTRPQHDRAAQPPARALLAGLRAPDEPLTKNAPAAAGAMLRGARKIADARLCSSSPHIA